MAYDDRNLAYDFSLFEDRSSSAVELEPKKESRRARRNNIVKIKEEQLDKVRRRKRNPFKLFLGFAGGAIAALTIGMIIFGQAQITELNQKIIYAEKNLSEKQSAATQMEMKIESKVAPSILESVATDTLGMSKATNSQKEFISLSKGDKAEVLEESSENIFKKLSNSISALWS